MAAGVNGQIAVTVTPYAVSASVVVFVYVTTPFRHRMERIVLATLMRQLSVTTGCARKVRCLSQSEHDWEGVLLFNDALGYSHSVSGHTGCYFFYKRPIVQDPGAPTTHGKPGSLTRQMYNTDTREDSFLGRTSTYLL